MSTNLKAKEILSFSRCLYSLLSHSPNFQDNFYVNENLLSLVLIFFLFSLSLCPLCSFTGM